jgi:predicted ATPase/DNA-binding CsgD family transcriptional regulator
MGIPLSGWELPRSLTSFIGRQQELAEVQRLLATERLLTLTGMGGCGKTRLALQAAQALRAEFAGGVWLLEPASLRDEARLPQLAVKTLGIPQAADRTALESLLEFVSSREMLLVLDNCEHLILGCARLASEIMARSPATRLLATSREPLAIPGEVVYPLSGLAYPQAEAQAAGSLQDLYTYDAVNLLVERVRRYLPEFAITMENRGAVLRICRRLDGMPLALELASARCNVLTLEQICARLDDRFSLLVARQAGSLEPRHSTLRAAIDWSYDLLADAEQALLRRLSVFASGCSLASVEAVCTGDRVGAGQVLDLLASLVEKSLLTAQTLGRSEARYFLPETIRQYAYEKLENSGEASEIRDRHLDHTLKTMEESTHKLTGPYQQLWLSWLDGEYGDVRLALGWSLERGRIEAGLRIAVAIYQYWVIRDYAEEGLTWLEWHLQKADEQVSLPVRANALAYAAFLAGFRGNSAAQTAYGLQAAELAEMAGEAGKPALRWALSAQAYGSRAEGDFQKELALDERVILLTRESGDAYQLGLILSLSSFAAMALGEYEKAQAMLEEGMPLLRQAGNPYRMGMALNFYGDLRRCLQDYPGARVAYEESILLLREINALRDQASVLHNLGYTCLHLGEMEKARKLFDESLSLQLSQGNKAGAAECLAGFAALAAASGSLGISARLLAAAVAIGGRRSFIAWAATRMEYELTLDLLRHGLSEQEFQTEGAAGRLMSLERAVALVRSLPLPEGRGMAEGLTPREREIAVLIAQGRSNGEIATTLVVSKRTVEKHIAHIMMKLAVTSRSQIVLWGIEHGLVKVSE